MLGIPQKIQSRKIIAVSVRSDLEAGCVGPFRVLYCSKVYCYFFINLSVPCKRDNAKFDELCISNINPGEYTLKQEITFSAYYIFRRNSHVIAGNKNETDDY